MTTLLPPLPSFSAAVTTAVLPPRSVSNTDVAPAPAKDGRRARGGAGHYAMIDYLKYMDEA